MLTEVMVDSAVKAVVGSGFSELVKRVFANNRGSERELIQHLVAELRRINSRKFTDIEHRLAILESVVQGYSNALPASGRQIVQCKHCNGTAICTHATMSPNRYGVIFLFCSVCGNGPAHRPEGLFAKAVLHAPKCVPCSGKGFLT